MHRFVVRAVVLWGALVTGIVHAAPHPRLLLDGAARERLKAAAKRGTPAWQAVHEKCEENVAGNEQSGYHGFDWAYAMAELALCWHATGEARYAKTAVRYFGALVHDLERVGDGQGGDKKIADDHGYPIRTHGVYAALGYDWLHDAPDMTPKLQKAALARLAAWLAWYRKSGYHNDAPGTNYFIGYATTQLLAGLAAEGETPEAAEWLRDGRDRLWGKLLLPVLTTQIAGGDFPEGWQYGELYAAQIALVAEAHRTAKGTAIAGPLAWLRDVIQHHLHALLPSGLQVHDGGDWGDRPCKPSRIGLSMIAHVLDAAWPERAAEARFVANRLLPAEADQVRWMTLVAERPGGRESDPRTGRPASLHIPSTGLSLMRSGWDVGAVWVSMSAGPHLVEDHQHYDKGHFELWRGDDALLVTGADYGTYATLNHNTLLVHDRGKVLNYSPNQGDWGRETVRTTHFADDGEAVIAVGDITDAYLPQCASSDGCKKRAVDQVVRTLVFVRPQTLWIDDRVKVRDFVDGVSWLGHTQVVPTVEKRRVRAQNGDSRLEMEVLLPEDAAFTSVKQPTQPDQTHATQDNPWSDHIFRLELRTRGPGAHRFLVVSQALGTKEPARPVKPIRGTHLDGGVAAAEAVLFSDGNEGSAEAPRGTRTARVVGLDVKRPWTLSAAGCKVTLRKGGAPAKTGMIKVALDACR